MHVLKARGLPLVLALLGVVLVSVLTARAAATATDAPEPSPLSPTASPVVVTLPPHSGHSYSVNVSSVASAWAIVAAHTQNAPVFLLSSASVPTPSFNACDAMSSGHDPAAFVQTSGTAYLTVFNNGSHALEVMVVATVGDKTRIVPGGCCTTCTVPVDPQLSVSYNAEQGVASLLFFDAALDLAFKCTLDQSINYDIYAVALRGNSFDRAPLWDALSHLSTPDGAAHAATRIVTLDSGSRKQIYITARPRRGFVFGVVVRDVASGAHIQQPAAYAAGSTYVCSFDPSSSYRCDDTAEPLLLAIAILAACVGAFLVTVGTRYPSVSIYLGAVAISTLSLALTLGISRAAEQLSAASAYARLPLARQSAPARRTAAGSRALTRVCRMHN